MCSKCVGKWSFAAHDAAHFNLTKRFSRIDECNRNLLSNLPECQV